MTRYVPTRNRSSPAPPTSFLALRGRGLCAKASITRSTRRRSKAGIAKNALRAFRLSSMR